MMNDQDKTKKLLLISLDGLSAEQFLHLSTKMGLEAFNRLGSISRLSAGTLRSPQSIWGEILSGKRWFESGCAGYAFPKSSLNDLQVGSESSYQFGPLLTVEHPETLKGNSVISINMPLLEAGSSRIWLSDGSFSQDRVSPRSLVEMEPYKSYRCRPFTSAAYFIGNPKLGIKHCLDTERIRLQCALQLIKGKTWRVCLIRLSLFDLLSNLLGSNYLLDEKLALRLELTSFLEFANGIFSEIVEHSQDATICVMSAYSNQECTSRINLNLLLSHAGYCQLEPRQSVKEDFISRQQVVQALAESPSKSYRPAALATIANRFLPVSIAASPTYGTIYLNGKERFADGVLSAQSVESTKHEIGQYIRQRLKDVGIDDVQIEQKPDTKNGIAPDLLIAAPHVAFHDLYDAPAIDNFNYPASCLAVNGFVSINTDKPLEMNTIQLNSLLRARLTRDLPEA